MPGRPAVNTEELAEIVENLRVLGSDVADVEVKKALGGLPRSVRETLSSFSNTRGGVIILGLDESEGFAATGLSDPATMAANFASTCSDEMEPPVRALVQIQEFEGAQVLVAEIPEIDRSQKPCYYKGAGLTKGAYIRVHDGDRQLSSYEVQVMLSSRGQPLDDSQPVPGVGLEALDRHLTASTILRLRESRPYAYRDLDVEGVLRKAKILVPDGNGDDVVSLAGLLALGQYPQEHFPQLMLSFVHYPSDSGPDNETGVRFLDSVAIEGPIPAMVRDAMSVIRRNMVRRSIVTGAGRQDIWEYPETALREAITNALVHRDLSPAARGTQVQIEMFPNRLVIRNPGGLYGPVTVENLGEEGVSSSRNALLLRILEDVPIPGEERTVCENRGSGIRAMVGSLRRAGMTAPSFDDRISAFIVAFPNHSLLNDEAVQWIASLGEANLTDSQCLALAILHNGASLDNATYRKAAGLDSRVATIELQDLVARELVEQIGTRRWARYRLPPRIEEDAEHGGRPRRRSPADRRQEILDALGAQTLSRAELAEATGLTDQTVRRWLLVLRREGLVTTTEGSTSSKNTKYRRIPGRQLGQPLPFTS
ncbi:putative transcriptional regulator [Micromonospora sp. L5]|nr:putative transcriptional regulator [Micromonospora sp. L5]